METLLLKANDIPRITSLSGNIDIDKTTPFIFQSQIIDIKRILGDTLYDKIASDYDAGVLTGDYAKIYNDYVIYILSYYTASYYIDTCGIEVVNNGIVRMNVDGGTAVDAKETNLISEKYRKIGIVFESNLLKFLETAVIPEYVVKNKVKQIIPWY